MGIELVAYRSRIGMFYMPAMKLCGPKIKYCPFVPGTDIHFRAMTLLLFLSITLAANDIYGAHSIAWQICNNHDSVFYIQSATIIAWHYTELFCVLPQACYTSIQWCGNQSWTLYQRLTTTSIPARILSWPRTIHEPWYPVHHQHHGGI